MTDQCIFFDGSFLSNKSGVGRDARVLLQATQNIFGQRLEIIFPKYTFFSRRLKISGVEQKSFWRKGIWKVRVGITGKSALIELPDNSVFIQPHLHAVIPDNKLQIKHIVRLHDIFPITNPEWFRKSSTLSFKASFESLGETNAAFLCDSNFTRFELNKIFPLNTSLTAYCPVQVPWSERCNKCLACSRDVKSEIFFLSVGTIEPRKNYRNLIAAWEKVSGQLPNQVKLFIVGKYGWKSNNLMKDMKKKKLKNLIWLGQVCDFQLNLLLRYSSSLISTSFQEGFNLTIAESLLAGNGALISDNPVHLEIYRSLVTYFETNNDEDLADKILIQHNLREDRIQYRNEVNERFDFEKLFIDLCEKLKKIIES